uniref:Transmembrane protein 47 n=1 Tax=Anopheles coluzzii TaxID=1518534 RepID=A0A8W7PBE0_ANOCL
MAPTTTIETVTITRPLKVIAFICGVIVIILMILALTSTDWLMAESWRQGLFVHCIEEGYELPLPFNLQDPAGCYPSRDVGTYIKATAALCIITLVTDALGTFLTGLGLRTQDHNLKYKFYRVAVLIMMVALISLLVAVILYPICFAAELNIGRCTSWNGAVKLLSSAASFKHSFEVKQCRGGGPTRFVFHFRSKPIPIPLLTPSSKSVPESESALELESQFVPETESELTLELELASE